MEPSLKKKKNPLNNSLTLYLFPHLSGKNLGHPWSLGLYQGPWQLLEKNHWNVRHSTHWKITATSLLELLSAAHFPCSTLSRFEPSSLCAVFSPSSLPPHPLVVLRQKLLQLNAALPTHSLPCAPPTALSHPLQASPSWLTVPAPCCPPAPYPSSSLPLPASPAAPEHLIIIQGLLPKTNKQTNSSSLIPHPFHLFLLLYTQTSQRIIDTHWLHFPTSHSLLNPLQSGFHDRHSTEMALCQMTSTSLNPAGLSVLAMLALSAVLMASLLYPSWNTVSLSSYKAIFSSSVPPCLLLLHPGWVPGFLKAWCKSSHSISSGVGGSILFLYHRPLGQ